MGYYYDRDLGLYYLNSRYYDSNTGRFINADSALYHNLQGYNLFTYCNNNPVNYVDYTGENAEAVIMELLERLLWLPYADGSLPIGDIIIVGLLGTLAVVSLLDAVYDAVDATKNSPQSVPEPKAEPELDENGNPVVKPGQIPTEKDGYIEPNGGPIWGRTKNGKKSGWKDKNGNIWIPVPTGSKDAHGGGHWDVQRPDGKGYTNVYPGGKVRASKNGGKTPIF